MKINAKKLILRANSLISGFSDDVTWAMNK